MRNSAHIVFRLSADDPDGGPPGKDDALSNNTIHVVVAVPDDIRNYQLAREPGESDDSYALRRNTINRLIALALAQDAS